MRKGIVISLLILLSATLHSYAQGGVDSEIVLLDSLMRQFDEHDNVKAGYDLLLKCNADSLTFDDFSKTSKDFRRYHVFYAYSQTMLEYSQLSASLLYAKKITTGISLFFCS